MVKRLVAALLLVPVLVFGQTATFTPTPTNTPTITRTPTRTPTPTITPTRTLYPTLVKNKIPVGPFTIVTRQGRPIPGSTATITDLLGGAVITWTDRAGTTVFDGTVNPNNILTFFADPGIYYVSVGNLGETKLFWTAVVGDDSSTVSVDRTADMLLRTLATTPTINCPASGSFCTLDYVHTAKRTAVFDFVLPSTTLKFNTILLSYTGVAGTVVWTLDWCSTTTGELACVPNSANEVAFSSVSLAGRTDALITASQWDTSWPASSHIVVWVSRDPLNAADTIDVTLPLQNVRMEFLR